MQKKMSLYFKGILSSFFLFLVFTLFVFTPFAKIRADEPCPDGQICNPIKATSIAQLLVDILEFVMKIAIPIIALAIIYAGFLFVTARGNSEKLETAKRALLYSLIGAAILLGSLAIAQLVSDTVNAL
ncbi:MAG: hypothetical protein KBD52_02610 [Candidatus Pacebacteria bacterium]|nr:hypothetical protein [Candidatus Paceibacterota bacterium]